MKFDATSVRWFSSSREAKPSHRAEYLADFRFQPFPTVGVSLISSTFPFVVAFPFDGLVLNIARSMDNRPTDGERLRVTRVFRNTTVILLRVDRVGRTVIRIAIPSNFGEISFRTERRGKKSRTSPGLDLA